MVASATGRQVGNGDDVVGVPHEVDPGTAVQGGGARCVLLQGNQARAGVQVDDVTGDRTGIHDLGEAARRCSAPASTGPSRSTTDNFSGRMPKVPVRPRMVWAAAPVSRLDVPTKPATNSLAGCS